jgi:hypothetical protein
MFWQKSNNKPLKAKSAVAAHTIFPVVTIKIYVTVEKHGIRKTYAICRSVPISQMIYREKKNYGIFAAVQIYIAFLAP